MKKSNDISVSDRDNIDDSYLIQIIEKTVKSYFTELKEEGIKNRISSILNGISVDSLILKKIRRYLSPCRSIELGKRAGRAMVQYRGGGIQIEPTGIVRWVIKRITITDDQIIGAVDNILDQIQEKYVHNSDYILSKIYEIINILSQTGIYKPETTEEKTLYDLVILMLINYKSMPEIMPSWVSQAIDNMEKADFIKELVDLVIDQISGFISDVSENLFLNFKVTFDSLLLRTFLNRKTNRGQISRLLRMMDINIKNIMRNIAQDYMSPSFIKGAGELIGNIAETFLKDIKDNIKTISGDDYVKTDFIPYKITMTPCGNNLTGRAFRWHTKKDTEESFIEFSETEDFLKCIRVYADKKSVPVPRPILNLGVIINYAIEYEYRYSAVIRGLSEGKTYYYRIGSSEFLTDTLKFKIGHPCDGFKFTVLADSQGMTKSDYELFLEVFKQCIKNVPDSDFTVHMGDFVDDGNNEDYWDWLFNSELWSSTAIIPLAGNHEAKFSPSVNRTGASDPISAHFNIQDIPTQKKKAGVYYSFTYADVLFIVLNTNDIDNEGYLSRKQYAWAIETAKKSKCKWKIILTHKSPYSNGPHHNDHDVRASGEQIADLAYECDIDLVIGGHDHVYVRTPVMSCGREALCKRSVFVHDNQSFDTFNNPCGTIFVVPGTSGVKNYKQDMSDVFPSEVMLDLRLPVYSEIEIKRDSLYFKAYSYNSETGQKCLIDCFAIDKQSIKPDGRYVYNLIDSVTQRPWGQNPQKLERIKELYNSLDYFERLGVTNYDRLTRTINMNKGYSRIIKGGIEVVKDRKGFLEAVRNPSVATIITQCDEIKFETAQGLGSVCTVDRDLCIRGSARLSLVTFKVKNNACFILEDSVCIDNTRRAFSPYMAINGVEIYDNSVFVSGGYSCIRCGYGIGLKGYCIIVKGSGGRVYLSSKSEYWSDRGIVYSDLRTSRITVYEGKYLCSKNERAFITDGILEINGGEIKNIKAGKHSSVIINNGTIGSKNSESMYASIDCLGKVYISGGTIRFSKSGAIYAKSENAAVYIEPFHKGAVKIADRVFYAGSTEYKDNDSMEVTPSSGEFRTGFKDIGLYSSVYSRNIRGSIKEPLRVIIKDVNNTKLINRNNIKGYVFLRGEYNSTDKSGMIICEDGARCFLISRPKQAEVLKVYKDGEESGSERVQETYRKRTEKNHKE